MTTPEARAAYYEQCWTVAAQAGNEARAEVGVLKTQVDNLARECRMLESYREEVEEIQRIVGCSHLEGLARCVGDLTNDKPCVIVPHMKHFTFSFLRFRKYPGGVSFSLFAWTVNGRDGAVIHFGIGNPAPVPPVSAWDDGEEFPTE